MNLSSCTCGLHTEYNSNTASFSWLKADVGVLYSKLLHIQCLLHLQSIPTHISGTNGIFTFKSQLHVTVIVIEDAHWIQSVY